MVEWSDVSWRAIVTVYWQEVGLVEGPKLQQRKERKSASR